ncbi:hypothetical protein [Sagittula sp. S175]
MKTKSRFIKSIVETAKACENNRMPWERGAPRAKMIARRKAEALPLRKTA